MQRAQAHHSSAAAQGNAVDGGMLVGQQLLQHAEATEVAQDGVRPPTEVAASSQPSPAGAAAGRASSSASGTAGTSESRQSAAGLHGGAGSATLSGWGTQQQHAAEQHPTTSDGSASVLDDSGSGGMQVERQLLQHTAADGATQTAGLHGGGVSLRLAWGVPAPSPLLSTRSSSNRNSTRERILGEGLCCSCVV
jgi:hypothetical protein